MPIAQVLQNDCGFILLLDSKAFEGAFFWKCELSIQEIKFVAKIRKMNSETLQIVVPDAIASELDLSAHSVEVQLRPLELKLSIPEDLFDLCVKRSINISLVSESKMRHMLGILRESSTDSIRKARLEAIANAIELETR